MADKRINALANTASSTASDDFIAVDGTTNGTRKLNAFSPTFGGNATVTGTLTVNGTGASSFAGRLAIGASALSDRMFYVSGNTGTTGASQFSAVVNPTIPNTVTTGAYGLYLGTNIATGATVTNGYSLFIAAPDYTGSTVTNKYGLYSNDPNPSYFVGRVLIDNSTASTSTSSGALVVSGGMGIAKQIVAGGVISIDPLDASPEDLAPEVAFCRGVSLATTASVLAFGSGARIGLLRGYQDGGNLVEWRFGSYIGTTFNEQMRLGGTSATSSSLTLYGTTASTSTSSGALVVSGGVGVAGAGFFGGNIVAAGNVVCGSATNQAVSIAGGTANDGGNVIVYGSTHASDPNTGRIRVGTTTITSWDSNDFTIASGKGLKVGNAYAAGAPTATGYIVIKDSTGTSYKIPAVAL